MAAGESPGESETQAVMASDSDPRDEVEVAGGSAAANLHLRKVALKEAASVASMMVTELDALLVLRILPAGLL